MHAKGAILMDFFDRRLTYCSKSCSFPASQLSNEVICRDEFALHQFVDLLFDSSDFIPILR